MKNKTNYDMKKIDEILEIENSMLNLSNQLMLAELNGDTKEIEKLNEYYSLSLFIEQRKFNELELNHDVFLEIVEYLKEKYNLENSRVESILFEKPNLSALRIIYRLMTLGMRNTNEKTLMNSFDEQKDILESLYDHKSRDISSNKELFGSILLEQQLARTYLYNIEELVKDNKELMQSKHNLSFVYGYQAYEDKMAIIESDKYLNFFKTDIKTYNEVSRSYLRPIAHTLLGLNYDWNKSGNKPLIKNSMLLKSIVFLLDDLTVRDLKNIAIAANDENSLNIIKSASIEKYETDNFKRR